MAKQNAMSVNRTLFDLGARLGSLEGYLYAEEKVEKKYVPGWIENIVREFEGLPAETAKEIAKDYREVWRKIEALLERLYGQGDDNVLRVKAIVGGLKGIEV
jgi:hypothetical protein